MSAVLHTIAFTAKEGAWNIVLAKRYRAGLHVSKHVYLPPGAQRLRKQRWALQQRAFSRMLPLLFLIINQCQFINYNSQYDLEATVGSVGVTLYRDLY